MRLDGVDAAVKSVGQETKSAIRQAVHEAKDTANQLAMKIQEHDSAILKTSDIINPPQ